MTDAMLIGKKLIDPEGAAIGTIDDIIVDPRTLASEWVRVRFGVWRDRTLVHIVDITAAARDSATCALTKASVRSAPPVHEPVLDAPTRHELLRYYGISEAP